MPESQPHSSLVRRVFPNNEWILVLVLAAELAAFGTIAKNFVTFGNAMEIIRLSVEVGLLALALTCVILTGGIDLSVGSMMGLCAVVFGACWQDAGMSPWSAAVLTLVVGTLGGALNAVFVTKFRLLPLIVTLGTFSLFRGLAEGFTNGIRNYTGFPVGFLYLGQGYLGGTIPVQTLALGAAIASYFLLVHRSTIGRGLRAIGFSPEGARFAGIPVNRRLTLAYVLSGTAASIAAIIYVAHLGQAKSDAGTGYELMAITAVVFGGTSIFGGQGTVLGTVLGLFAIVILQNGLRLAALPAEMAGVCTGVLLIATITVDRLRAHGRAASVTTAVQQEIPMKNSQVAVLSAVILAAAGIVAASNWYLVRSLRTSMPATSIAGTVAGGKAITVGMMPKAKGDPYFVSCKKGAEDAAAQLNVNLIWDGPTDLDPAKQNEVVEGWITRGVDAIAVSVENAAGISTVLRKARAKGIKVITWDADAEKDARDFFINQATPQGIGYTLTDEAAKLLNATGEFAVVTSSMSAANQNEWIKHIRARIAEKYPKMKLATIRPCDGDRDRAFTETQTVMKVFPNVKLIMDIAAPAVPGSAEAVKQSGRTDVKVIGLSLPNMCKPYVHAGVVQAVVLWNTLDLGYLTVLVSNEAAAGRLKPGVTSIGAGRLGRIQVEGDEVMLGKPFVFRKDNIDKFDF